jgi:hypothetical protein
MACRAIGSALLVAAGVAGAQQPAPPTSPTPSIPTARTVAGRVLVQRDSAAAPLAGAWVTLHRVAEDASGPLDSARTDARGAFAFRYRATGTDEAIYFVSTRYGGVAYFTRPLRAASVTGEDAEIAVFDTTSAAVPPTVRGRHLIVSAPEPNGARTVIEVFELSNDTSLTVVERPGTDGGVWSTPVPASARGFEVRAGEVPSDALALTAGRAVLHVPLAPGIKQLAFSYTLTDDAFPLTITTEAPTAVLEVLLEDARGSATGGRLVNVAPVTVEGRSFRRFLAQDLPRDTRIVVDVARAQPSWIRWLVPGILAVVGAAMIGALAWSRRGARRTGARLGGTPSPAPGPSAPRSASRPATTPVASAPIADEADAIARRIAALDDAFESREVEDADARVAYERERGALKESLASVLAARSAPR